MKRILIYAFSALLLMTACETLPEYSLDVETCPVEEILYNPETGLTEVTIYGRITGDESLIRERGFIWAKEDRFDTSIITVESNAPFSVSFNNMEKDKEYFVKAYVRTTRGDFYGEYISFKSISPIVIENATDVERDINGNFVTVRGRFISDGGTTPSRYGIRISESESGAGQEYLSNNLKDGMFSVDVKDVKSNTDYYVEVFGENPLGEVKSNKAKVHTLTVALAEAAVMEDGFIDIKPQSLTVKCKVLSNGNDYTTTYGIKYGLSEDNLDKEIAASEIADDDTYVLTADNLETGTKYYFKAYAKNTVGTNLSAAQSASTLRQSPPMTSVSDVTQEVNYTWDWAKIESTIIDDGGIPITERGVYIGKTPETMTKVASNETLDSFFTEVTGLEQATKYYYTSYAINSKGEGRGEEIKSFYTGVLDKDVFERDEKLQFKSGKLVYYLMEPFEVTLDGKSAELIVLDRNLGATKQAEGKAYDCQAAGGYYKWGSFEMQVSPDMAWLSTKSGKKGVALPKVGDDIWNGVGDKLQNTDNSATSWRGLYEADPPQASNPCPAGFHVGTQSEWSALLTATGATNEDKFTSTFKFCYTGEFSPTATWDAITQAKTWMDGSKSTTPANPTGFQLTTSALTNLNSTMARKRALPVRCIKDY